MARKPRCMALDKTPSWHWTRRPHGTGQDALTALDKTPSWYWEVTSPWEGNLAVWHFQHSNHGRLESTAKGFMAGMCFPSWLGCGSLHGWDVLNFMAGMCFPSWLGCGSLVCGSKSTRTHQEHAGTNDQRRYTEKCYVGTTFGNTPAGV